jgi:hypothetical protein
MDATQLAGRKNIWIKKTIGDYYDEIVTTSEIFLKLL